MRFFYSHEWKNLWPFYLEGFLGTFLYVLPSFLVLYFKDIGFSATQIGLLLSVRPLSAILSELPTGAIADLWGRKKSGVSGYVSRAYLRFCFSF